jgi:transposase InsO family protein
MAHPTQKLLARRHHLHPHNIRLAASRRLDRPLQPRRGGLEVGATDGCRPGHRGSQPSPRPAAGADEATLIQTDQGSQYQATAYRTLLQKRKVLCSVSAKSCCRDNTVVEGLFSTLKLELSLDGHREVLISPQQQQRDLAF